MTETRRTKTLLSCALAICVLAVTAAAYAYPKPAVVPYRWELDFEAGPLRLFIDQSDGRAYWFFTYEVTNNTGKDQIWAPDFALFTDAGEIVRSGRTVPLRVTRTIMELLGDELLMNQNEAIGELLQGAEYARSGVVLWRIGNVSVNQMSMFVKGISGESARLRDPLSGELVVLYKTLQRDYLIPGDLLARGSAPVELSDERWILR